MAEKKETKEKETKTTTKKPSTRKTTKKKEPVETKPKEVKKEELVETPIPDPEKIDLHAETNAAEAIEETPIPDPEPFVESVVDEAKKHIDLRPEPIPEAKPEKLETLVINEDLEDPDCKKEDLGLITTGDLPVPKRGKAAKSYDPGEDVMITTADFKPRKIKDSQKL